MTSETVLVDRDSLNKVLAHYSPLYIAYFEGNSSSATRLEVVNKLLKPEHQRRSFGWIDKTKMLPDLGMEVLLYTTQGPRLGSRLGQMWLISNDATPLEGDKVLYWTYIPEFQEMAY